MRKILVKTLLYCISFMMLLMFAACDAYVTNLESDYLANSESSTSAELTTGEADEDPFGGMFDVWTDITQELGIDFMEQYSDSIKRVVIFINQDRTGIYLSNYIIERSEIEFLHRLLTETIVTFVNMHPTYMQSIRGEVDFAIVLEYYDGTVDEIQAYERGYNVIVRMLNVKRDDALQENIGFILGVNERIWEFIDIL